MGIESSPGPGCFRTCDSCGFENAPEGRGCPLCGASAVTSVTAALTGLRRDAAPPDRPAAASPAERLPGQLVASRYRVERVLGRGGMGEVYLVVDESDAARYALKVIRPALEQDPQAVERFRREIGILERLRHPAIPAVHDAGASGAELFLVTDFVDGHDLKSEIQGRGPWAAPEAALLGASLADALGTAHALGIVHRDVKPSNVMLARDGSVRLVDFGLARGGTVDATTLTRADTVVGTPGYMSPEQFEGGPVDARSDVYSLGIVLYELTTGRLPFTAPSPLGLAMKHKAEPPPSPREVRPDLPAWMERVILRCLEKQPDRRFGTAAELAAELRRPRPAGSREVLHLPGGETVVEDRGEETPWPLVVVASVPRPAWAPGTALRYGGRFFRLEEVDAPAPGQARTTYRFRPWPEEEILRLVVDYEPPADPSAAPRRPALTELLTRWLPRRRE